MSENGPRDGRETDAVMRALRAPGTERELAEEERYRALFRQESVGRAASDERPPTPLRSRAPRRIVVSAAAAAALAVATGGVAAAYTGSLPQPIQTLAHHVIGAPRPAAVAPSDRSVGRPGGRPGGSAAPGPGSPSAAPHHRATHRPAHHAGQPRRTSSGTPSSSPSTGLSTSPAPTQTPTPGSTSGSTSGPTSGPTSVPVVTAVTVVGTSHLADVGAQVSFTGQLTLSGTATDPRRHVALQQHVGHRWVVVRRAVSDADGQVSLVAPSLQRTSLYRLRAGRVHSLPWRVAMHPLIATSVSASRKVATITAHVQGGRPGDLVMVTTRRHGAPVTLALAHLDVDGTATFTLSPTTRTSTYNVVLLPTKGHTGSKALVKVRLAAKRSTSG